MERRADIMRATGTESATSRQVSQNSRKDGDHDGDEPADGHAGRRCPRPRLDRRWQKALPRPEPRWQKALPRQKFLAKGATESRTRIFSASGGDSPPAAPAAGRPIRECRRQHHIATITTATVWRRWGAPPLAMLFAEFETAALPAAALRIASLRTSAELRCRDCRHHHLQKPHMAALQAGGCDLAKVAHTFYLRDATPYTRCAAPRRAGI